MPYLMLVPAGVLIEAGTNTAEFVMDVLDDGAIDGPQSVTMTAKLTEDAIATATLVITDNESTNLVLNMPALASEAAATLGAAGTVRISGTLPTNLTVALTSSLPDTLRVPPLVNIPAGRVSATFNLTIFDDLVISNAQEVSITASADAFGSATGRIRLLDNDAAPIPYGPAPGSDEITAQNIQLSWLLGAPELIANGGFETGTLGGWHAEMSAAGDIVALIPRVQDAGGADRRTEAEIGQSYQASGGTAQRYAEQHRR